MVRIAKTSFNYEKENLIAPFGFKGSYVNELWQVVSGMKSESGHCATGIGVQSVLWSDENVFSKFSNDEGNRMMTRMTEFALKYSEALSFETPLDLMDKVFPATYEYGRKITGLTDLRPTFVLNSLVSVDNAAWILYCRENHITLFDDMVPADMRSILSCRHSRLGNVPLLTYNVGLNDISRMAKDGYFLFKIKIGADPDRDSDRDKMLEWDKKRISDIHLVLKDVVSEYTRSRHVLYYLDANGRYDSKERLMRLLNHISEIGALERVVILEEPFPCRYLEDLSDLPVRVAADESIHSEEDVAEHIKLGYKAIALKPMAKTVSMSLKMARTAHDNNIPCFCADLTVNPFMVDWNKNFAARLEQLPELCIGILESNGHQNYANWEKMRTYHPCNGASWTKPDRGIFKLDEDFYNSSGGIFMNSDHYGWMSIHKELPL